MKSRIALALTTSCLLAATLANAASDSGYYRDSQKGWWWGERIEEEEKEEEEPPKPAIVQPPPQEQQKEPWLPPRLSTYQYEDVWNMHPDEFYELQEAYKKKAVQDPSEANTKDYYELSEIGRKKALAFTNASQYIWQKYPQLSTAADYSTTTPGNLSRVSSTREEVRTVLRRAMDDYALIFFWSPNCPYCDDQRSILKWFEGQTGWTVKPVGVHENPALAAKVGISMTPSIILIKKGDQDYHPVSAGVVSGSDLEDMAYRSVRLMNGDITPEEYSIHDFQRNGGFDVKGRKDWVKEKKK